MATSVTLTLPFPVSANQYWKRGRNGVIYVSKDAQIYKRNVADAIERQRLSPFIGDIRITVHAYMPSTNRDLGNTAKVLEDALEGYLYLNDLQIVEQHYYRHESVKPKQANAKVIVTIEAI